MRERGEGVMKGWSERGSGGWGGGQTTSRMDY